MRCTRHDSSLRKVLAEERLGFHPVALRGALGQAQRLSRLVIVETGEELALEHLDQARMIFGQTRQRLVNRK